MLIYGIKHEDKICYIGQTIRKLERRISSYKNSLKNLNNKLYITNHLRKYGIHDNTFIIIEDNISSQEILDEKEIFYIKEYNTLYPNGLNLTNGGRVPTFSEETRRKMSDSKKGKVPWNKGKIGFGVSWNKGRKNGPQSENAKNKKKRFGKDNHFFGKKHSDESKKKMGWRKGIEPENKKNFQVIRKDNETKEEIIFLSIDDACISIFSDRQSILRAIRKKYLHKGFYFDIYNIGENKNV